MNLISFVIPCYKSEYSIKNVVEEIVLQFRDKLDYDYEIILVNDASPDDLQNVIKEICKKSKRVKYISLCKNFGQHGAIMAGFRFTKGKYVVTLDDDGQCPTNEIFRMIELLESNHDIVIAKFDEKKQSILKNIGSKVNDIMASILIDKPRDLKFSSFCAYKDFVIKEIIKYQNSYPYIQGLALRVTNNIVNLEMEHRERQAGESTYNLKKLISMWLNGFTAFSVKPLRIATVIGSGLAFLGFLYAVYTVINKIINPNILIGWSSIMAVLLIVSGVILFMLGLIGEYIGRIYISINSAPQYVIRESVNIENE